MANEEFSPSEIEQLRRAFQEAALKDFPNPDRVGCPPDKTVLKAIAAKALPLSDPAWRHTARCSPCFREVKAFEAEAKTASNRWKAALATAAAVLVVVALFFFRSGYMPRPSVKVETATMDLRRYSAFRREGENPSDGKAPVTLNRGHLTVTVLLPTGADTGRYEYKVLNDGLQMVLSGEGDAKLENHSATLAAQLDTGKLPSGTYSFWLRHRDSTGAHIRSKSGSRRIAAVEVLLPPQETRSSNWRSTLLGTTCTSIRELPIKRPEDRPSSRRNGWRDLGMQTSPRFRIDLVRRQQSCKPFHGTRRLEPERFRADSGLRKASG